MATFSLLLNIDNMYRILATLLKSVLPKFWYCYQFAKILTLLNFGKFYFDANLHEPLTTNLNKGIFRFIVKSCYILKWNEYFKWEHEIFFLKIPLRIELLPLKSLNTEHVLNLDLF